MKKIFILLSLTLCSFASADSGYTPFTISTLPMEDRECARSIADFIHESVQDFLLRNNCIIDGALERKESVSLVVQSLFWSDTLSGNVACSDGTGGAELRMRYFLPVYGCGYLTRVNVSLGLKNANYINKNIW